MNELPFTSANLPYIIAIWQLADSMPGIGADYDRTPNAATWTVVVYTGDQDIMAAIMDEAARAVPV